MATGTRSSKRAQPVTTDEDNAAARPTKRGRRQQQEEPVPEEEEEEEPNPNDQLDQEDDEDAGREEALRFSLRAASASEMPEDRREYILNTLPELASHAGKIVDWHRQPSDARQKQWNKAAYHIKSMYLGNMRKAFQEPDDWPFIEPENLRSVLFSDAELRDIGFVNLATALDLVEGLQAPVEGVDTDDSTLLGQLDDVLHRLYEPFGFGNSLRISLNIRSLRFMKALEDELPTTKAQIKKAKVSELLANYFIEPSALEGKPDYVSLFAEGPYRDIGHGEDDAVDESCQDRVAVLLKLWNEAGKGAGLAKLQDKFPLDVTLDKLRVNIIQVYDTAMAYPETTGMDGVSPGKSASQTQEQFYKDQEDIDDLESVTESQPIVRPSTKAKRFYTGPDVLHALSHQRAPPSNQLVHAEDNDSTGQGPRAATTVSYQSPGRRSPESVRHVIGAEPRGPSIVAESNRSPSAMSHRQRVTFSAPEEDDDEKAFEEDGRTLNKEKAADISKTLKARPRPPQSSAVSMPPPPRPSSDLPSQTQEPPPSSAFEVMRDQKAAARARTRPDDAPIRQRTQWSDNDTYTLMELIKKTHAQWSKIDQDFKNRWEFPRNAQAYRDKARNIKVDVLSTDRLLPPCFDLVRLSAKEINQVKKVRKNPLRMERDVGDDGSPINTEWNDEDDEDDS